MKVFKITQILQISLGMRTKSTGFQIILLRFFVILQFVITNAKLYAGEISVGVGVGKSAVHVLFRYMQRQLKPKDSPVIPILFHEQIAYKTAGLRPGIVI